jgi:hypothetical protein
VVRFQAGGFEPRAEIGVEPGLAGGERRIGLLEPQTLYYEFLAGAEHLKLWTAGWKEDLSES